MQKLEAKTRGLKPTEIGHVDRNTVSNLTSVVIEPRISRTFVIFSPQPAGKTKHHVEPVHALLSYASRFLMTCPIAPI